MSRIESLTQKQKQQLVEHREEYLRRGLSTDPIDREIATKAIGEMYRRIGEKKPYYWVCSSPLMCELVINIFENMDFDKGANLRDSLGDSLGDNLRDNLWDSLGANLGDNLWDSLGANLWDNLRANLRDSLGANLGDNLRANLWDNLWDNLKKKYHGTQFWGQQDNFWVAFYQYPRKYLGLAYGKDAELLDLWDDIGRSCCWWYPYKNIVFISDRPCEIHKNERGQLHKDGGPALLFRDGYCLWMLNGVAVSQELVMTPAEEISAKSILEETNSQVRAEIIKKVGYSRILKDLQAEKLDEYREYELYRIKDIDIEPIHLCKFNCPSTGTYYALRVPPQINKAEEAIAWCNHGVKPGEFVKET